MSLPLSVRLPVQDQEIAITDETYLSALGCLGDLKGAERARALESVERAFELIARKGPSPGPRVLVRVGVSYAQADMWDKALSVFEAIVSSEKPFFDSLSRSVCFFVHARVFAQGPRS